MRSLQDLIVLEYDELYWWEFPDDDQAADWSAWVLATLQWLNRQRAGIVPIPRYEKEEMKEWLMERRPPEQLSLRIRSY